ncbi:putative pyridine nucleotide-disulfide oxidoreductase-like protein [Phaeoacremonium minimum UCRPA7]|uniref:Putative pyridine nucleotide-disulfide oxidoreductase-like protein n=1 Tax=Phaeoacremonium minimum (strain UCR-PA7) TaxID=1286976 RepID=R8BSX5_PHAM7|nr:putative pyridine nucleotide-disulfide oxidoreductase-like protein [Phaeoacremonium minimum UCRPA7]EOO02375.1 putative pyridine nucleotide-disulfide oxidoreductase-like protein [Phaeoacremonium minimum UCRPA7]
MTINAASAPYKALVLGGSYGGLSAALNLIDLCDARPARCGRGDEPPAAEKISVDVTIVDERDGFYHLIGSPLAFASEAYADKAWVKYEDVVPLQAPNVHVIQGTVNGVDCSAKTATITESGQTSTRELTYDFLVVASGLRRVFPVVPQSLRRKMYLFETGDHIRAVTNATDGVVVVGGGAVGIEMAAELKLLQPNIKVTLVHSRDKLLSSEGLPDDAKDRALELVQEAGVETLMNHRVADLKETTRSDGQTITDIKFTNGESMTASRVIMAVSRSIPSTTYLPSEALDQEGYVKIQPSLNFPVEVPNSGHHFAIGDLAAWSGIKRCGGAMHMGYYAASNIHQVMLQQLQGRDPKFNELAEIPPMIGLAVGKKAMSYGPGQGVMSGEDVMEVFFGDDLGFTICWKYLKLGLPIDAK